MLNKYRGVQVLTVTWLYCNVQTYTNIYLVILLSTSFIEKNYQILCAVPYKTSSYSYLLFSFGSEYRQSLGELFVGFFKYYALDCRYGFRVQHVACMRCNNGQWFIWVWCKNGSHYDLYRWNSDYISVATGSAYPRYSEQWKRKPIVIEGRLLLPFACIFSVT